MASDFNELAGVKKPLPSQNATTGLQQINSTAEIKDPELVKKEKLLKEIEKKNDDDTRKLLTVPIDPMKN